MATRTNRAVGSGFSAGPVSSKQLIYALGVLGLWTILYAFFRPPALPSLLMAATAFAVWAGLTTNDPDAFWDSFKGSRKWISASPQSSYNDAGIPTLPKTVERYMTFKRGKQKQTFWTIEPEFNLNTYGAFLHGLGDNPSEEMVDRAPGFLVCSRGPSIRVTCAWELFGYTPTMTDADCETALQKLSAALSRMPNCHLRFVFEVSDASHVFLNEIERLKQSHPRTRFEYLLLKGEEAYYQEMAKDGRIQSKRIVLYATMTALGGTAGVPDGLVEVLLSRLTPLLHRLSGDASQAAWSTAMRTVYGFGISPLNKVLQDRESFGLAARQLSWRQMWERDWEELHHDPAPLPPQLLLIDEAGVVGIRKHSDDHALSVLFQPENAQPAIPEMGKHVLFRPTKGDYQGFLRIGKVNTYPTRLEAGNLNAPNIGKFRFIWNALKDCPNSRYIVDISPDQSGLEKHMIDFGLTNSVKRMARAAKKGTVDVGAEKKRQFAVEALDASDEGEGFYYVSGGIWVTRRSIEEVDQTLSSLAKKLGSNCRLVRELDLTEFAWMQSQSYTWNRLMEAPSFRREKYQLGDLLGLIPLVRVAPIDSKGLPMLSRDGTPLFLDLIHGSQHALFNATTRGGKSVQLARLLLGYWLERSPILVLDFPPPTGSSTFDDLCSLIRESGGKATYFNVRNKCMNVLEKPNIEGFRDNPERYDTSQATIKSFHLDILKLCVVGLERDSLSNLCDSLLGQIYVAFQNDPEITKRYEIASKAGYGKHGYELMPTLAEDFLPFAKGWVEQFLSDPLRVRSRSADALDYILTQLEGVCVSALGDSIAHASTIDPNADMLVMALKNADDGFESAVYALAAYGFVSFKSMSVQSSAFIIDEGLILFENPAFPKRCAQVAVNGLKWGCHLTISAQNITAITNAKQGQSILDNVRNKIVGFHEDSATQAFIEHAHFKREIVVRYSDDALQPNKTTMSSHWYLKHGSRHLETLFCPSAVLLAAVANDPKETAARRRYLNGYNDSVEAMYHFSKEYAYALKNNIPVNSLGHHMRARSQGEHPTGRG